MKKENLYFVSKCLFNIQKDITVIMPGDMPKEKKPEEFKPYEMFLVGVYSNKPMAQIHLNDSYLYDGSGFTSDDDIGPNYFYNIHGYYHKIDNREAEVINIDGKKYAKTDSGFLEVIEDSPTSNFEDGGFEK